MDRGRGPVVTLLDTDTGQNHKRAHHVAQNYDGATLACGQNSNEPFATASSPVTSGDGR